MEGPIKNRQSREKLSTQGKQDEEKQNNICVGHHHTKTNTSDASKTLYMIE